MKTLAAMTAGFGAFGAFAISLVACQDAPKPNPTPVPSVATVSPTTTPLASTPVPNATATAEPVDEDDIDTEDLFWEEAEREITDRNFEEELAKMEKDFK